jgi:hypothetical protein
MEDLISEIVAHFGGIRPTARELNKKPSTVQNWVVRGKIHSDHWADIVAASGGKFTMDHFTAAIKSKRAA